MTKELNHLRRTLKTFSRTEDMEFFPILTAIHECAVPCQPVYSYTKRAEDGGQLVFSMPDGNCRLVPMFFSVESAKGIESQTWSDGWNVGIIEFESLARLVAEGDLYDGILVEPQEIGFVATPPLLKDALDAWASISHITLIHGNIFDMAADMVVVPVAEDETERGEVEKELWRIVDDPDEEVYGYFGQIGDAYSYIPKEDKRSLLDFEKIYLTPPPCEAEQNKYLRPSMESELKSCYRSMLFHARTEGVRSIMFPCIGTGGGGMDIQKAIAASTDAVLEELKDHPEYCLDVYFCCPDAERKALYQAYFDSCQ